MQQESIILSKLENIESMLAEHAQKKDVLNFTEASKYIDVSPSHLYKLTSGNKIPHYKPEGKRVYFNRQELDKWLQRNRVKSLEELDQEASTFVTLNKKGGRK